MNKVLAIAILIGASFMAYYPSLSGQFVYDDKPVILKNPLIRNLHNTSLIFGTSYWGAASGRIKNQEGGLYRPLTTLSFALNYFFGGLGPKGYHLVNLLLHVGASLLFFALCLRIGLTPVGAWGASLVFALLPIHTEVVCNVVGRSELLAAFFILASWLVVLKRPPSVGRTLFGTFFYLMALLSKESAAAFLGVLILSDLVLDVDGKKAVLQKRLLVWIAYLGALALYLQWRYLILGNVFSTGSLSYFMDESPLTISLTMCKFLVRHYLWPLVSGISLCAEYTRPAISDSQSGDFIAWACLWGLLVFLSTALYWAFKTKNRAAWCFLIFLIFLFPVSNLVVRLEVIGAERFLYSPSVAYGIALALLADQVWKMGRRIWFGASLLGIALCLWYGFKTHERALVWQTENKFWQTTVLDAPKSPRAWNGLGYVLMNEKKYDEALNDFNKALGLNRRLLDADYNMATCFFLKGDYARAKRGYLYVAGLKPYDPDTLFHLAILSEKEKDFKSARAYYERLLAINPQDEIAQDNLVRMKGIMQRAEVRL